MCYAGLASESQLKVRLRCKACHASNSSTPRPQHCKINCTPQIATAAPNPHPHHRKINCTLQIALVEKAAWCVAMRPLLKVRLRCKACHALPCEDRQPPQNQLQLAECSRRKSCVVGCDVGSGVGT